MVSNKRGLKSKTTSTQRSINSQTPSTRITIPTQSNSDQLSLFEEKTFRTSTSSPLDFLAKTCQLLESGTALQVAEAVCSLKRCGLSMSADPIILSLKTSKGFYQVTEDGTLSQFSEQSANLGFITPNGNCLILRTSAFPKTGSGCSLSDILEEEVDEKYFLSKKIQERLVLGSLGQRSERIAQDLEPGTKSSIGGGLWDA